VKGDGVHIWVCPRYQRLRDLPMPEAAARGQDVLVECLARKGVNETDAYAVPFGFEEMSFDRALDDREQSFVTETRELGPKREGHLLPNHRGHRQRLSHVLAEPPHPSVDHLP
jgi:hypothetical protein